MDFSQSRALRFGAGFVLAASLMGFAGCSSGEASSSASEDAAADNGFTWTLDSSDVKWPDPQSVLSTKTFNDKGEVETQQVLASAKGTYNVLPLWLGIADTVCDSPVGMNMDGSGEVTADAFRTSGLFGTYASPANSDPDVYMSNLFYSYVNTELGLSAANRDEIALICSGQPTAADTTISIGGTCNSLYYRPDLVVGGNQAGDAASGAAAYVELVNAINDGSIGSDNYVEGDEDYDPVLMDGWNAYEGNSGFQGSMRGTAGMLYDMAQVVEDIKDADSTKVTRYGNDTQAIAEQFEELFLGTQAAILEQIDSGKLERKVVAVVNSVDKDTQTANIAWSDPSVQLGNSNQQAAAPQHALQDVCDNLAFVLSDGDTPTDTAEGPAEEATQGGGQGGQGGQGGSGGGQGGQGGGQGGSGGGQGAGGNGGGSGSGGANAAASATTNNGQTVQSGGGTSQAQGGNITITLAELAQADLIVYTGQNTTGVEQSDVEDAFAAAGITDIPTGVYVNPTNVGTGNYDADKAVFFLNWLGAAYPEVATSTDLLGYFYNQIAHVDDRYIANVLALNCANMTLVGDDTLSHDNAYFLERVSAVQDVVDDGMAYLTKNLDEIVAEHINLEPIKDASGNYRNTSIK